MPEGPVLLPSGHVVFTPPREFDLSVAPDVLSELHSILELHPHVAVDISHVEFLDSSGLGVLVAAQRRAIALEGDLVLCGQSSRVERLLELTGLDQVFTQYPDSLSVLPWSSSHHDPVDSGSVESVG